jgi:hypothetical protein
VHRWFGDAYEFFLAPAEAQICPLKLFCRNICNFLTNIFFWFIRPGVTVINDVLQTTSEENITNYSYDAVSVLPKCHC